MLRDRYEPMNLFDLVPALGMIMDPALMPLDTLLDNDALFPTAYSQNSRTYHFLTTYASLLPFSHLEFQPEFPMLSAECVGTIHPLRLCSALLAYGK
jgi:hypothetical protein